LPVKKLVYEFSEGGKDQEDLLGGKGANLAEMTRLGLPVPPDSPSPPRPVGTTWSRGGGRMSCGYRSLWRCTPFWKKAMMIGGAVAGGEVLGSMLGGGLGGGDDNWGGGGDWGGGDDGGW